VKRCKWSCLVVGLVMMLALSTLAGAAVEKIADGLKLTLFCELDARTAATRASHNDVPGYQLAMEWTGVNIDYWHPPAGQAAEQFNLMLVSGDLADIIVWGWKNIPGGPQKAIDDGAIIPLNDLVSEYAPNIAEFLNTYPHIAQMVVTDDGVLYSVPFLRPALRPGDDWQRYSVSPQLRLDWLEELGLELPTTIAEWESVLEAFKQHKPEAYPFVADQVNGVRWFTGAFGINLDFYHVDGEVKYGAIQPEYKEYLTTMNRWYKKGLLDPDFMSTDYQRLRTLVLEERAGSYWGLLNRDMGGFTGLARARNPEFKLTSAPWPYYTDGNSYNFTPDGCFEFPGGGAAISSTNKHPVESMKWMDFWWSEEGLNLANFGIEGLTYNWTDDGFPQYTDLIMKNPDGLSPVNALSSYTADGAGGRFWPQDARYWRQMMALPEQYESGQRLANTGSAARTIPPVTATDREARELASIINEIDTYRDEMLAKFIMGIEPLDKFDEYVQWMKRMGIDRAVELQQAALDRYQNRPIPTF
jgi:putative aldouronate transport system substrate-binding protein